MPFKFECVERPEESHAQIASMHRFNLAFGGSMGEAAALGTYLDEVISLTNTQYDPDRGATVFRDFDPLALVVMSPGWDLAVPRATAPHPLDSSIHANLAGGIELEVASLFGHCDPLQIAIKGLPENVYRLVERRTTDGSLY